VQHGSAGHFKVFVKACTAFAFLAAVLRLTLPLPNSPNRDAKVLRFFALSARFARDAGARENDDADRGDREHPIVAPEWRVLGVAGPIRLDGDLRNFAAVGPAGGDNENASGLEGRITRGPAEAR
jgi:hypothetical protein